MNNIIKSFPSALFQKAEECYPILCIFCALGTQEFFTSQDARALQRYIHNILQLQEPHSWQSMFLFTPFLNLHSTPIKIVFIPIFYIEKKWIFSEIKYLSQGYTELRLKATSSNANSHGESGKVK